MIDDLKYGECPKHRGNSMFDCPMCAMENFKFDIPKNIILRQCDSANGKQTQIDEFKPMKKKLQLEILDPTGNIVVTHYFFYNAGQHNRLRLTITDNEYVLDSNGKLVVLTQEELGREADRKEPVFPIELDEQWATRFKARHNVESEDKTEFRSNHGEIEYFNKETGSFHNLFEPDTMIPIADKTNILTGNTKNK